MSYILEALKKLEEKRRRESPPGLLSAPAPPSRITKKPALWPYLLAVVLLINAAVFWQMREPKSPKKISYPEVDPQPAQQTVSVSDNGEAVVKTDSTGKGINPAVRDDKAGHLVEAASDSQAPSAAVTVPAPLPEAAKPANPVGVNGLPPSVRQPIPSITIAGHFYSPVPSSRVAVVNGKTLHEGESLENGLKLEQITPDGAVFSFQGYRFHRTVF